MDNISLLGSVLVTLLKPFLSYLLKEDEDFPEEVSREIDPYAWEIAKAIWSSIKPEIDKRPTIQEAFRDVAIAPYDEDALASLRFRLKKLLAQDPVLTDELASLWMEASTTFKVVGFGKEFTTEKWLDTLDSHDEILRRLEIVRLLREGMPPEKIAEQFNTNVEYLYRLNASFSLNSTSGILSDSGIKNWFDNLNKDDPIIRRLEIIRLHRSGTPLRVIANQYNALPDYILRLNDRFLKYGVIGILTEDDFQRFRSIYPEVIRICTYNLHGVHKNNLFRFRRIASELSAFDPDLGAFQEVISGNGVEETSAQIARWMSRITGYYYRTQYTFCHLFMDKYPEGISMLARHQLKNIQKIDLSRGLDGFVPHLDRYAVVAEVEISKQKIIFVSVHLDHEDQKVRLAQAEKLLRELDHLFGKRRGYCYILAGDFNDVEDSPVMTFFRKNGYKDAFRSCHIVGGNTFDALNPHKRIDYIMVRGDVNFLSAELVPKDPELSDHIGVFAIMEIKRAN